MTESATQFSRPPVTEIVAAIQFRAIPQLTLRTMIDVGNQIAGYELDSLQPELPPIVEPTPRQPIPFGLPQLRLSEGLSHRGIFRRQDSRFVAQLQRDRIAINERGDQAQRAYPSSQHVLPELDLLGKAVDEAVGAGVPYGPRYPVVVELTYTNVISAPDGADTAASALARVLRPLSALAANPPDQSLEATSLGMAYLIEHDGAFCGRVRVAAQNVASDAKAQQPIISLSITSRVLMIGGLPDTRVAFGICHDAAVSRFADITTPEMHQAWEQTQ